MILLSMGSVVVLRIAHEFVKWKVLRHHEKPKKFLLKINMIDGRVQRERSFRFSSVCCGFVIEPSDAATLLAVDLGWKENWMISRHLI